MMLEELVKFTKFHRERKKTLEFGKFYTKEKEKRILYKIFNESLQNRKWFFIGFYAADGSKNTKQKCISFRQKNKITLSG